MQGEVPELLRARVAVDGDRDQVADPFEHRQLAGLRVTHGAEEEAEESEELAAVGTADRQPTTTPQTVGEAELGDVGPRALRRRGRASRGARSR